jgi:hypothetical protein
VAEVEIRGRRVEAHFDDERLPGLRRTFELGLELAGADDVDAALRQIRELFPDGHGGSLAKGKRRRRAFALLIIPTT